jgi:hypothetical protein
MEQKGGQVIAVFVEYASRTLTENSQLCWKCGKHMAYYVIGTKLIHQPLGMWGEDGRS